MKFGSKQASVDGPYHECSMVHFFIMHVICLLFGTSQEGLVSKVQTADFYSQKCVLLFFSRWIRTSIILKMYLHGTLGDHRLRESLVEDTQTLDLCSTIILWARRNFFGWENPNFPFHLECTYWSGGVDKIARLDKYPEYGQRNELMSHKLRLKAAFRSLESFFFFFAGGGVKIGPLGFMDFIWPWPYSTPEIQWEKMGFKVL